MTRSAQASPVARVVWIESAFDELVACERPVVGVPGGTAATKNADRIAFEDSSAEPGAVVPVVAPAPGGGAVPVCPGPAGLALLCAVLLRAVACRWVDEFGAAGVGAGAWGAGHGGEGCGVRGLGLRGPPSWGEVGRASCRGRVW